MRLRFAWNVLLMIIIHLICHVRDALRMPDVPVVARYVHVVCWEGVELPNQGIVSVLASTSMQKPLPSCMRSMHCVDFLAWMSLNFENMTVPACALVADASCVHSRTDMAEGSPQAWKTQERASPLCPSRGI